MIPACAAAADEIRAVKHLVAALEAGNSLLKDRLASAGTEIALLTELNKTRAAELDALRTAVAAKNEAINAKDAAIAGQKNLIDELKKKKPSPLRRIGDILAGAAIFAILK